MKRIKTAIVLSAFGVSVAMAVAYSQETSVEPRLFQADSQFAPRPLQPEAAPARQSLSDTPSDTSLRSSAFDAPVGGTPQEAPAKRPSAAERLKQIRGASGEGSSSRIGASISAPVNANPAEPQTIDAPAAGGSGTVSVLKKAESGTVADRPAERTTARRLLRSPTRMSDAANDSSSPASTPPASSAPAASNTGRSSLSNSPAESRLSTGISSRSASEGTILTSQAPSLRVEATGPSALMVGKEALYTVAVYNEGTVRANDVLVRVSLPRSARVQADDAAADQGDGAQQLFVWTVGEIEAKASQRFTLRVTPIENEPIELTVDWATRPAPAVAQIQVQQPQLDLLISGARDVLFGETAVYTLRISNPGTGDAEDVAVEFGYSDLKLEPKRIPVLAAGQQIELKVELNATHAGPIQVVATASGANGLQANASQDVLVRRAKLEIEVTGEPVKFAGSMATYQIRVRNTGDAPATDVTAAINVPTGAEPKVTAPGIKASSDGQRISIGSLGPNAEKTIDVQYVLTAAGENPLTVVATAATELEASASFTTRVEALADLKLSVNDPSGPVAVGKDATYEVHIENRGTKAATNISVIGQFSQGIEPQSVSGGKAEIVPGQVLFQTIPRIEPGQEIVFVVKARADSEGNKRFRAEVTSQESDTQLVAQETTYFYSDPKSK